MICGCSSHSFSDSTVLCDVSFFRLTARLGRDIAGIWHEWKLRAITMPAGSVLSDIKYDSRSVYENSSSVEPLFELTIGISMVFSIRAKLMG